MNRMRRGGPRDRGGDGDGDDGRVGGDTPPGPCPGYPQPNLAARRLSQQQSRGAGRLRVVHDDRRRWPPPPSRSSRSFRTGDRISAENPPALPPSALPRLGVAPGGQTALTSPAGTACHYRRRRLLRARG